MSLADRKADFPLLRRTFRGQPLAYLDNAATTQKPQAVLDALTDFYTRHNANVHRGVYALAEEATALYEGARAKVAAFFSAPHPRTIVFTRGTTDSINLIAQAWARRVLRPGDEILVTELEHHSNLVPWQMAAQACGARLAYLRVLPDGRLNLDALDTLLSERTRLVAVAHTSNVLGTVLPLDTLIRRAHSVGAKVLVDAAQAVARSPIDVTALDCDFLACSGHKLYGPTGIGVLYVKAALLEAMEPASGGGGMIRAVYEQHAEWAEPPWRFEAGTPPIAQAAGLAAAVAYVTGAGLANIAAHEGALTRHALARLAAVPGISLYGPPAGPDRAGVLSFNLGDLHPHDVSQVLDQSGVAVRGGHHCAQVLMRRLEVPAVVRASFALYNDEEDVERLVAGLGRVREALHG